MGDVAGALAFAGQFAHPGDMGVPLNIKELVGVDVVDEGKHNFIIEISLEVGAGFLGRAQPVLEIGAAGGGDLVLDAVRTFARGVRASG